MSQCIKFAATKRKLAIGKWTALIIFLPSFFLKQSILIAESHETNPRDIEIIKMDFASPNKVFFICKAKESNMCLHA